MKTLFRHRSYLRRLSPAQRRNWLEQKRRLSPRVPIGTVAALPDAVRRSYAYINLV